MEFPRPSPGARALHVSDDLGRRGEVAGFDDGVGGGELDFAVGLGEEGFDLGGLRGGRGEGAAFGGAFGARVLGGGDRFGDGFGHLFLIQMGFVAGLESVRRCFVFGCFVAERALARFL